MSPTKPKPHDHAQQKERKRAYEKQRGSAWSHGYGGKAWEATRRRVFRRDLWVCQVCGKQCGVNAGDAHCDHKVPRPRGAGREHIPGIDDEANLQTLCPRCHSLKTRREA
jgi:5-methylcytosine-specific restriction endonuclease McrA